MPSRNHKPFHSPSLSRRFTGRPELAGKPATSSEKTTFPIAPFFFFPFCSHTRHTPHFLIYRHCYCTRRTSASNPTPTGEPVRCRSLIGVDVTTGKSNASLNG
ncbi:hypothetical protein Hdeb2414_s0003g00095481 [Helianthus debilis subsp. tardiflorus]